MSVVARGRAVIVAVLAAVVGSVVVPTVVSAQARPPTVKVMTRNMYVGADLTRIVQARSVPELLSATAATYNTVLASDPPERIEAIAREIADADPTILGLQEVSLLQRDTVAPTNDGPATPATTTVFDFLQLLQGALAAQGTPYTVVTAVTNTSAEAPTALGFDAKLTDRDVVLAKADLPADELSWTNATSANFATRLTFTTPVGPLAFLRGYNAADFTANKRSFRLVNTHLEASSNDIRTAQARELLSGPLSTGQKHVLVGDVNSGPREAPPNPYEEFAAGGFADSWTEANPLLPGPTCCFSERLTDPDPSVLHSRIDVVLTRNASATATVSRIYGTDPDNRTPSGRWPSDHAGVNATIAP